MCIDHTEKSRKAAAIALDLYDKTKDSIHALHVGSKHDHNTGDTTK